MNSAYNPNSPAGLCAAKCKSPLWAALCRGEAQNLQSLCDAPAHTLPRLAIIIGVGAGLYGATIGLWRSPLQGCYTALKFPLLIGLTTVANALLNGVLAQAFGLRIGFRQVLVAITASFAIASVILASLSPVALFLLLNTPALGTGNTLLSHNLTLVAHVGMIAFAGAAGNLTLFRLLAALSGNRAAALRALVAWLAGNLFLGCQLSWLLRPFIGSPTLPVDFLRADAFSGNFYESVWRSLMNMFGS